MPLNTPNIVLIVTDQQQHTALGRIDDSYHTPNIDHLAESGVQFTGCHSTSPQCSPSQSSIITGLYPHQNGMYTLPEWGPGPLDTEIPSAARAFRDGGYQTSYIGKWHLGDTNLREYGLETTANIHETSNPPEGFATDKRTRDQAVSYLSSYDEEEPFFLTVSFNLPHPPFIEDEEFADQFSQEEIPIPNSFDEDFSNKPTFQRERADSEECELDVENVRNIGYKYRTMVSRVDDHVGHIMGELAASGLEDDTIVIFTSDHGDMQGAHRLNKKGVIAYDEILRVPLIMRLPDKTSQRDQIPDLVSLRSIPATLIDVANVNTETSLEEESLLPALDLPSPPDSDQVFFEHRYAYWGDHPYRGVRTTRWKFVEYMCDEPNELYDMLNDPGENTNLATHPVYGETVERLQEAINEWWRDTDGDEEKWLSPLQGP